MRGVRCGRKVEVWSEENKEPRADERERDGARKDDR